MGLKGRILDPHWTHALSANRAGAQREIKRFEHTAMRIAAPCHSFRDALSAASHFTIFKSSTKME